jgi:hypothetical protein
MPILAVLSVRRWARSWFRTRPGRPRPPLRESKQFVRFEPAGKAWWEKRFLSEAEALRIEVVSNAHGSSCAPSYGWGARLQVPTTAKGFPPAKLMLAESLHFASVAVGTVVSSVRAVTPVLSVLLHALPFE